MTRPTIFQLAVCLFVLSVMVWYEANAPTVDEYNRAVVKEYMERHPQR